MTGYYMDMEILQPIYDFIQQPYEIKWRELIDLCLEAWLNACERDYWECISMESFTEECNANELYFDENGNLISL
jgi:hypothetical protein